MSDKPRTRKVTVLVTHNTIEIPIPAYEVTHRTIEIPIHYTVTPGKRITAPREIPGRKLPKRQ